MQNTNNSNKFIQFLKDEKFIEWKLLPNDELDRYWDEYLQQHPEEAYDVLLAEMHFKNIDFSSIKMPQERKEELTGRLQQSLNDYNRKRFISRFSYVAAACVVILFVSILYFQSDIFRSDRILLEPSGYIVGNELEQEDILFISGNKTSAFQSNIDVTIENDKTAQISSEQQEAEPEKIAIEKNTMNKLIVPYGKRSKIVLADGTQVWLNSGSSLEFPSSFSGAKRDIYLTGEMYVEVAPDAKKPFYVHTSDYDVRVYGTKFNVSSYTDAVSSVVLVEGSVGLQKTQMEEVKLSPNQQAVFTPDTDSFYKKNVDVQSLISWKNGYLLFDDTPVTEALKLIERYYNLSFNYGDNVSFQELTCTGKIILSENINNVMEALSLISNTEYNKEEKRIYIYKK